MSDPQAHAIETMQVETRRFPPPSEVQNEIRFDYRWLDGLILRCLETDPARRLVDAGQLLSRVMRLARTQLRGLLQTLRA